MNWYRDNLISMQNRRVVIRKKIYEFTLPSVSYNTFSYIIVENMINTYVAILQILDKKFNKKIVFIKAHLFFQLYETIASDFSIH